MKSSTMNMLVDFDNESWVKIESWIIFFNQETKLFIIV